MKLDNEICSIFQLVGREQKCAVHCLFEHNHLARCRQTGRQRSPIFASCASWYLQIVANFREIIANVCKSCRQTLARCGQTVAKQSPNVRQFSPVVRVGRQRRASWSPTARNSQTPFEHCAQIGSGLRK